MVLSRIPHWSPLVNRVLQIAHEKHRTWKTRWRARITISEELIVARHRAHRRFPKSLQEKKEKSWLGFGFANKAWPEQVIRLTFCTALCPDFVQHVAGTFITPPTQDIKLWFISYKLKHFMAWAGLTVLSTKFHCIAFNFTPQPKLEDITIIKSIINRPLYYSIPHLSSHSHSHTGNDTFGLGLNKIFSAKWSCLLKLTGKPNAILNGLWMAWIFRIIIPREPLQTLFTISCIDVE